MGTKPSLHVKFGRQAINCEGGLQWGIVGNLTVCIILLQVSLFVPNLYDWLAACVCLFVFLMSPYHSGPGLSPARGLLLHVVPYISPIFPVSLHLSLLN